MSEAGEPFHARHWLLFDRPQLGNLGNLVTGCGCGFLADIEEDGGYGDSVIDHMAEVARASGAARLAAVEKVLADEPPLLAQFRSDMGAGFPNELSERRGRTITGWVDRLHAALHPDPSEASTDA